MPLPPIIQELVDRFVSNRDAYRSPAYNETQLRHEFLDPMFEALGWDVNNRQGYAEAYKDVIHEDAIRIGSAVNAPDYCFRIGGGRKFFVEAKKPSVNIRDDRDSAYQLRRYAWSAKLPLSVLTDFEEFAVYDCRINPDKNDSAAVGRILYITFDQYPTRWNEIADVFSREAILKGSFDKFAESRKGKRGTVPVGVKLLEQIEAWRALLAKNLALRNPQITQRELNFAVQRTIDRIIFLRMCEDRGIEPYGQLLGVTSGPRIYASLRHFFRQADDRYNSGIFHFHADPERAEPPDELTPSLEIDDKVLKEIITHLYYPDSPYEFSVLPPEILGQVYEQFLGKVIRLTPGHQAKVEEKPEVRKAGGVYYTPAYIVDYIVKHTVGRLVEEKTPKHASKLRVLDPACGSGSFLVGAYQYLLDWHRDWYVADGPEKHRKEIYQGRGGQWLLASNEKRRILLNNIYGVDIDPQAVEVTKLSLLLKVLENENQETVSRQFRFTRERALPDLGRNIKCGNSLIGPDIYHDRPPDDFTDEDRTRINAFDWNAEFPEIMKAGGFDAVIGNPPWGAEFSLIEQTYIRRGYDTGKASVLDSYALFIEQSTRKLKEAGILGFITPDTFLRKDDYLALRRYFLLSNTVQQLVETGPVFSQVRDTWCLVFTLARCQPKGTEHILHRKLSRFIVSPEERIGQFGRGEWDSESMVAQHVWQARPRLIVGYRTSEREQSLVTRIEEQPPLGQQAEKFRISRGEEGSKFNLRETERGEFRMVTPADVERFWVGNGVAVSRSSLTSNKVKSLYMHPKIWIIRIQKMRWKQRLVCAFDARRNSAGMKTLQIVVSTGDNERELKYLSGILASRLMNFWCTNYLADDMNQAYLEKLPIRPIDFSDPADKRRHDKVVKLVESMLKLHRDPAAAKTPDEKTRLERQIAATDKEINALVYELYGLTEEEIRIVEGDNRQ